MEFVARMLAVTVLLMSWVVCLNDLRPFNSIIERLDAHPAACAVITVFGAAVTLLFVFAPRKPKN